MNAMNTMSARRLSSLVCAGMLSVSMLASAQSNDGYVPAPSNAPAPGYLNAAPAGAPAVEREPAQEGGYLNQGNSQGGYLSNKSNANDAFVPATADARENINGGMLMLIAYALFWVFTLVYVASLARRGRDAQREVADLRNQIRELDERLEDLEAGKI